MDSPSSYPETPLEPFPSPYADYLSPALFNAVLNYDFPGHAEEIAALRAILAHTLSLAPPDLTFAQRIRLLHAATRACAVIGRLVALKPSKEQQDYDEVARRLREALAYSPTSPEPEPEPEPGPPDPALLAAARQAYLDSHDGIDPALDFIPDDSITPETVFSFDRPAASPMFEPVFPSQPASTPGGGFTGFDSFVPLDLRSSNNSFLTSSFAKFADHSSSRCDSYHSFFSEVPP